MSSDDGGPSRGAREEPFQNLPSCVRTPGVGICAGAQEDSVALSDQAGLVRQAVSATGGDLWGVVSYKRSMRHGGKVQYQHKKFRYRNYSTHPNCTETPQPLDCSTKLVQKQPETIGDLEGLDYSEEKLESFNLCPGQSASIMTAHVKTSEPIDHLQGHTDPTASELMGYPTQHIHEQVGTANPTSAGTPDRSFCQSFNVGQAHPVVSHRNLCPSGLHPFACDQSSNPVFDCHQPSTSTFACDQPAAPAFACDQPSNPVFACDQLSTSTFACDQPAQAFACDQLSTPIDHPYASTYAQSILAGSSFGQPSASRSENHGSSGTEHIHGNMDAPMPNRSKRRKQLTVAQMAEILMQCREERRRDDPNSDDRDTGVS